MLGRWNSNDRIATWICNQILTSCETMEKKFQKSKRCNCPWHPCFAFLWSEPYIKLDFGRSSPFSLRGGETSVGWNVEERRGSLKLPGRHASSSSSPSPSPPPPSASVAPPNPAWTSHLDMHMGDIHTFSFHLVPWPLPGFGPFTWLFTQVHTWYLSRAPQADPV